MTAATPECPDCLHARQRWNWGGFRSGCAGCEIRAIAGSPPDIREKAFDQAERQLEPAQAREIKESVRLEVARIVALKGTR